MASLLRAPRLTLVSALALGALPTWAQNAASPASQPVQTPSETTPSSADLAAAVDAELFYELLVGEMSAANGDFPNAVALMLEAAHTTNSPQLYRRATELALQSRSGQRALMAAHAWQQAWPDSRDANRYVLQILLALNRVSETPEPLTRELAATPPQAKPATYLAIAQLYSRVSDKILAAAVIEQALQSDLHDPESGPAAWAMLGHMRVVAGQTALAQQAAQQSHALSPYNGAAALLALELLENGISQSEPLVIGYLERTPSAAIRMAYARVLMDLQRTEQALEQIEIILQETPDLAEAWMALATLQAQAAQWDAAQQSLRSFVPLAQQIPDSSMRRQALTQAYLLGARVALQARQYDRVMQWLDQVPEAEFGNETELQVQSLRALVLARQGKPTLGRALIRTVPAHTASQQLLKHKAEVQFLRETGEAQQAYELQQELLQQTPDDINTLYDTALLAEKAGHLSVMEELLRRIIARQPDHHHAYNALGYSLADRGIRLDEARQLIETALSYAPNDPFITDSLGWLEFRAGNLSRAQEVLEKAYAMRDDTEIAAHLGEVLWNAGQRQRALSIWRKAQQRDAYNEVLRATLERLKVRL